MSEQYWRMQLHPAKPSVSMHYAVQSIAAGFIGLDFATDPGDMKLAAPDSLPEGQKDYYDFAHRMAIGDKVLVMVHHYPFALVTVEGDYNYIKACAPEIGVWFRHFRRINKNETRYYADRVTHARQWEQIAMVDTISILKDPTARSYQLIHTWR
jgi:hypothetical protein